MGLQNRYRLICVEWWNGKDILWGSPVLLPRFGVRPILLEFVFLTSLTDHLSIISGFPVAKFLTHSTTEIQSFIKTPPRHDSGGKELFANMIIYLVWSSGQTLHLLSLREITTGVKWRLWKAPTCSCLHTLSDFGGWLTLINEGTSFWNELGQIWSSFQQGPLFTLSTNCSSS